jgi:MoxR-like ATPase
LLAGKPNVGFDDVRRVAPSVLGHRLILDYSARMEGHSTGSIVSALLDTVTEIGRPIPHDIES